MFKCKFEPEIKYYCALAWNCSWNGQRWWKIIKSPTHASMCCSSISQYKLHSSTTLQTGKIHILHNLLSIAISLGFPCFEHFYKASSALRKLEKIVTASCFSNLYIIPADSCVVIWSCCLYTMVYCAKFYCNDYLYLVYRTIPVFFCFF